LQSKGELHNHKWAEAWKINIFMSKTRLKMRCF
jgi:hypothetical protein